MTIISLNTNQKRLLSNFISLLSMQGLNYILPLLTMPYLFRTLGAEKYGLVSFALSTVMFLNILVEYGFNLSATREVSSYSDNKEKLIKIYSLVLSAKIILLLISFIILNILILFFDKFSLNWDILYLSFLFVIGNALFPVWFFQGIEEMKYISYLNIVAKLFFTIGIFIFVKEPDDYLYQPFLNGLGYIFVGVYSLYFISYKYQIKFKKQSFLDIKKMLKDGWDIFVIEFMPNLYNNFSIVFLGFITTMENVGIFSLATNVVDVFNKVIYILRNVTYPYINKNRQSFKKITMIMISFGFLMSVLIFTTSKTLLPLLFGDNAIKSLIPVYILAISPLLFSITFSYGSNKLLLNKGDFIYKKIMIFSSIMGIILSIFFSSLLGIIGTSTAIIIVRLLIAIKLFISAKEFCNEKI